MRHLHAHSCRIVMLSAAMFCANRQVQAEASSPVYQEEELVVTATRTPNPVSKLPVATEVITRLQIEASGARTLSDALEGAHDVNALEPASGRLGLARIRGLDSRLTLVLIDGMRMTSGFQGYSDLREIPAGIIDRIEIVRGSGSALYGSDAVGGIINVITRQPTRELHGGLSLSGGESRIGQAGTVETGGWLTGTVGKLGFAASGSFYDRDRYDREPADLMTDGDSRVIGSGSLALTYDLKPGLKILAGTIYTDNSLDGLRTQSSGNFDRSVDSDRLFGYVGAEIRTGRESTLILRAARTTYDWSSLMDNYGGLPNVTTKAAANSRTTTTETWTTTRSNVTQDSDQFEARWTGKPGDAHRLTAGVEYLTEEREDSSDVVTRSVTTTRSASGSIFSGPTTSVIRETAGISHDASNLGLFLQDEVQVLDPLLVIVGVRYDDHSDFGGEVSPKVAALLRINDHLKLRASYGEGFRAPSLYELHTGSVTTKKSIILANPDLGAETSRSYELGADAAWKGLTFGVTAFRNEVRNLISQVLVDETTTPDTYRYENLSKGMTRGIEINAGLRLPWGLTLSDKVAFLDTENESTGAALLFAPDITNSIRLEFVNAHLGLKGNIRVVSTGTQHISATEKAEGYSLVNCFLSKGVTREAEVYAGVDNLFNDDANTAYGNNEGAGLVGTWYYCGVNCRF